jgi:hypothetical protein
MDRSKAITKQADPQALAGLNDIMTQAGQYANEAGARVVFTDHTARKAKNTGRKARNNSSLPMIFTSMSQNKYIYL